mmetsp:Transcript_36009/g.81717  ORF Transcript_36009/g.81717 Transcript_36009/m.81717 type:complete len:315 (-) Transcript_36009:146-1090(-)
MSPTPSAMPSLADVARGQQSTCVEPDSRELIRSVSTVLHRRIRDNESIDAKTTLPLFLEDTHTEPEVEEQFALTLPLLHVQLLGCPTLYELSRLPPPPTEPRAFPTPEIQAVVTFIENIWHKARLTPQSLVITLVYVDRLEARSEGVLLHARSWRPIVFSSLLLASKVWHDISYWNSDFSSICPMFHVRNINRMERAYLQLLQYDTIISASQYAQYYFSLRHVERQPSSQPQRGSVDASNSGLHSMTSQPVSSHSEAAVGGGRAAQDNFRSKYFMALNVPGAARLQEQSAVVGQSNGIPQSASGYGEHMLATSL